MDLNAAARLLENGQVDQAEEAYRKLAENSSLRAQALYGLGLVSLRRKDVEGAAHWFTKSLETDPRGQNSLYYLADIAASRGDQDSAIKLLARILALNPRHQGALTRLSNLMSPENSDVRRPPRPPSSPDTIVGIARNVKLSTAPRAGNPAAQQLLTFRVEVVDAQGHPGETIGVEMRNMMIKGNVEEGDWVEIGRIKKGGRIKAFNNLSTNTRVVSRFYAR